ncbi:MAG: hypothetical protein ACW97A_04840 [Candidatus Thorarchaeota archaeon]|jgi:hypothetical protein
MSSKNRTIYKLREDSMMRNNSRNNHRFNILHKLLPRRGCALTAFLLLVSLFLSPQFVAFSLYSSTPQLQEGSFYTAAEVPELTLTSYSRENTTHAPVLSDSRIAGDHIVLNASWSPSDNVNGTSIHVNATAIPLVISENSNTSSVEIDTRALGNNVTCTINATVRLDNGSVISEIFTDVFLGNFFFPSVTVLAPNGGEVWTGVNNITWSVSDRNQDEVLTYEVLISSDSGDSFELLGAELTDTWFEWDSGSLLNKSTYLVEVRAFDGIYTGSDQSDSTFTAGELPTSTPTLPPPTSPPAPSATTVASFVAAAIIASVVMSIIVYYVVKRQF